MALSLNVRPVRAEDAEALTSLLRALEDLTQIAAEAEGDTRARVQEHLRVITGSDRHTLLVAEDARGALLGYVSVHWQPTLLRRGGEGYVSELFVHPGGRGGGIGTELLARVYDEARARGCARLQLENMRHKPSYQRGYYAKRGWQERPLAANFVYDLTRDLAQGQDA